MALPTAWTEDSLTVVLEDQLLPVTADLDLETLDVVATAVSVNLPAVLHVTSVDDVTYASISDVVKVLMIGQWVAWQAAYDATLPKRDLKAGTVDTKQSQQWEHLKERLSIAYGMASRYSEVLAFIGGSIPMPFSGGLSKSAKQARRDNTDYVQPYFTRTTHEPVGAGSETD